jgi:hypothetical protein
MKDLKAILDNDLSPDKLSKITLEELSSFLFSAKIVASEEDLKMLIVEKIQESYKNDDEFPIIYYKKEDDTVRNPIVENQGPSLTDDYIENHLKD